ncbi:MAG: hypothetical protein LUC83_00770 [Clostridiales bacterium]|nr:hypothetical protein [Clostridiales bacterium]
MRIHTEQQLREFERSVAMFGQIRPIVVDENRVILAGNGLYDTLIRMGRKTADVYQYNDLSENQKKKLMIADNKIFNLGIENLDTLNSFLEDLRDDLDIPGYDEEILKQMVADADEITEKISEYGTLDDEEISAIRERTARKEAVIEPNNSSNGFNGSETLENGAVITRSDLIKQEQDEETAEIKRFIICPNCGEKIWL